MIEIALKLTPGKIAGMRFLEVVKLLPSSLQAYSLAATVSIIKRDYLAALASVTLAIEFLEKNLFTRSITDFKILFSLFMASAHLSGFNKRRTDSHVGQFLDMNEIEHARNQTTFLYGLICNYSKYFICCVPFKIFCQV